MQRIVAHDHALPAPTVCPVTAPAVAAPPPDCALAGTLPAAAVDWPCSGPRSQEDAPYGDITSADAHPGAGARATAVLAARVPGVLSGGDVFAAAMKLTDPDAAVELLVADGAVLRRRHGAGAGHRERPRRAAGRARRP